MFAAYLWIIYAFSAAILWGLGYVLAEKIMNETTITPPFLMIIMNMIALPLYFLITNYLGEFKNGWGDVFANWQTVALLVIAALTTVGGNILILHSIHAKNATLASMIEISYPLFVVLFTFLIFKSFYITWEIAFGGFLIFLGSLIILLKS